MRRVFVCALLAVLATAVYAADSTGKWSAPTPGRGGNGRGGRAAAPMPDSVFVLKADGKKLTGTAQVPSFGRGGPSDPVEITEGKVDGDNISFTVPSPMGMDMFFKGKVSGDTIEFDRTTVFDDYGTPPVKMTAKRVK